MSENNTLTDATLQGARGDPLGRSQLQMWFEVSVAILICLVAFTGNMFVVIAIHFDQRLNTITNMLIENLAFSDIFMAAFHMPFWIISLRYGRWVFQQVTCQLVGLTQLIFGVSSLFTMTGVALNRYLNVVRRNLYFKYFSTKKTTIAVIMISWLGPVTVTTPQLYGWGEIDYHVLFTDCTCVWRLDDISFIIFLCVATIFLAAVIISFCYYRIYKAVQASSHRMQGHVQRSNVQRHGTSKAADRTEVKVLKTSFVVVCVYMVCWTPLSIVGFIEVFGAESPRWVHFFAYVFVFGSSLINPFIYGIMNPQFQRAFKNMLRIQNNEVRPISIQPGNDTKNSNVSSQLQVQDLPSTYKQAVPVYRSHGEAQKAKNESGDTHMKKQPIGQRTSP